jgi:hypothetical protein
MKILGIVLFTLLCVTSVGLSGQPIAIQWEAPATNTDGTPLKDLAGYRVSWGPASKQYTNALDVGNRLSYPLANLAPGTWFIAVAAYDQAKNSSAFSNEIQVVITETQPPLAPAVVAIDAGATGAYTAADGTVYQADIYYTGGEGNWPNQEPIANTVDPTLYRSNRSGQFSYAIPLANGTYTLTLQFAEVYFTGPNQRRFDVLAEGQPIVSNLDLVAVAGLNVAHDVVVPVTIADGTLNLEFKPLQSTPLISAIRVMPAAPVVPPTQVAQAQLSWKNGTGHTGIRVERQVDQGPFAILTQPPAHLSPEIVSYVDTPLDPGHTYCWRVVSFSAQGDLPPSNVVCESLIITPPIVPATGATDLQLQMSPPPARRSARPREEPRRPARPKR